MSGSYPLLMQSQWLGLGLILCLSACAYAPRFIQNVHEVVPGKVYRSAQLSPERLTQLIDAHGLRSVLNLRGASPGEPWYDDERRTAHANGLTHYDFALSSKRDVSPEQADALIRVMRELPKPMLIHCWAGADRTGLASALYLYAIDEKSSDEAARALAMRYHHFSFTSAGAMDRSFARYVETQSVPLDAAPALAAEK